MKRKNISRLLRMFIHACKSISAMQNRQKDHTLIFIKDYLTEEEAAIYLSCKVSYVKTLMRGDKNGPIIPYYQPTSNNCYIARVDLDRFITRIRHRSADEIRAAAQSKKS